MRKLIAQRRVALASDIRNGRTSLMDRRQIGRPSKGDRKQKPLRLPVGLMLAGEQQAQQYGMSFNDLVGRLLSDHLRQQGVDVDELLRQSKTEQQQELPLAG
jgi:hypothetical protein